MCDTRVQDLVASLPESAQRFLEIVLLKHLGIEHDPIGIERVDILVDMADNLMRLGSYMVLEEEECIRVQLSPFQSDDDVEDGEC